MKRYLSANEASEMLGVSKATLYAYVSRGLIRSEETNSRARRYLAEDVQKLAERKVYRRDPAQAAQDALHWGTPLLDSALTLITDGGLYYRGRSALALAETASLEAVAALLWTGDAARADTLFAARADTAALLSRFDSSLAPAQRLTVALAMAQADDLLAYDLRPEAVARTGARILLLLAAALAMVPVGAASVGEHLARAWRPEDRQAARLIDAALILCADHELNVSSFTARVVASAEANPYAVVTAGLAALSGFKHGGNTGRVEALLREIGTVDRIGQVTAERLRRGERIPGFGHSLYAQGDPRARTLLSLLQAAYPGSAEVDFVLAAAEQIAAMIGHQANVDFALAALAHAVHLPEGAPLLLFALGRTVGWIGHAIEQYTGDTLIRPRARYVGDPPED